MRWTKTLIPTLKEAPAEAEIISHQLLLRAGLVRKLAGGLYTFLPMGLRVLRKIEAIVRQEMDGAGACEVLMPALQPPEIWRQSGRYEQAAQVLFKVRDSSQREWLLGPTHEEVITSLAASEINSYRQMPVTFYQIQTKFRDEIRPRFGLMRAREFLMKDAYSFDISDEAAQASYQKMYDAYVRIFGRCGLKAFPVEADTGVMGGKFSHEFMVPAQTGECEVAYTEDGQYAANLEKAASRGPLTPAPALAEQPLEQFPTPGVRTIEDLAAAPYHTPGHLQIKTLVYLAEGKPVLLLLRGDDSLNEAKAAAALGTGVFRPATAEEIASLMGAHPGSLGAVGFDKARVLADEQLRGASGMTTGANVDGFHFRHVCVSRDIPAAVWKDLRTVREGEESLHGPPLKIRRAIEVGHVFKLGTKYSEAMSATFLGVDAQRRPLVMGCYGMGITRTLQAIIESSHDQNGIIWPIAVAPYAVCLTPLSASAESEVMQVSERLYAQLGAAGVEVIMDDRDERPGVKFKDSELVGFPLRIAVGEKSLNQGMVEFCPRGGTKELVPVDAIIGRTLEFLRA